MDVKDFYYELPPELIAQDPLENRSDSRLMVLGRQDGTIRHARFSQVADYMRPGDCLVLNNTKVIPARLMGEREGTGGKVEILLLTRREGDVWEALAKPGKKARPGTRLLFGDGILRGEVLETVEGGNRLIRFSYDGIFEEILDKVGQMPIPPYIKHSLRDKDRYQTVYAKHDGSAAAPTAGLHFTERLLREIREKGVRIAEVTLHVGLGTFRPVKTSQVQDHHMHSEFYQIGETASALINRTKQEGGKVICVGTTSCRTLESAARNLSRSEGEACGTEAPGGRGAQDADSRPAHGPGGREGQPADSRQAQIVAPCSGWTDIFIYPGFRFQVMDALVTNFHLPESTLIMLVSAFAGRENVLRAYEEAVKEKYRFFSFGDAMLII